MIIDSIEKLKELSKCGLECHIRLKGGFKSSKHIYYNETKKKFEITNYIDDTEQSLTEKQLMDSNYKNIGIALQFNELIKD